MDWRTPNTKNPDGGFVDLAAVMAEPGHAPSGCDSDQWGGELHDMDPPLPGVSRVGMQLAPVGGSMGYGLPAAIGAKCLCPDREVIAFAGDGCFLMTGQELATAVQERLQVIVIVANNGMYGTIRLHQMKRYPGRPFATDILSPDFAALARSFGAYAETVKRTNEFASAFQRARSSGRAALIELRVIRAS